VTILGITLRTVPGTVQGVVPGGIPKGVFPVIREPISGVILAAIWTIICKVNLNATVGLICSAVVAAIRMRICGATFGVSREAVCTVVPNAIWMGTP
jgi:hypothetical protein